MKWRYEPAPCKRCDINGSHALPKQYNICAAIQLVKLHPSCMQILAPCNHRIPSFFMKACAYFHFHTQHARKATIPIVLQHQHQQSLMVSTTHIMTLTPDTLSTSPRSPTLPPRAAPVGGKTCPILNTTPRLHAPHFPLPPLPELVLNKTQGRRTTRLIATADPSSSKEVMMPDEIEPHIVFGAATS